MDEKNTKKYSLGAHRNNVHVFSGKLYAAIPFLHLYANDLVGTSSSKSWHAIERVKK
jgi:hypothetical protein